MVENRPWLTVFSHVVLCLGVLVTALPIWIAFVASTHPADSMLSGRTPLLPGGNMLENYATVLGSGVKAAGSIPVGTMLWNSFVMALMIAVGKIAISIIAAYAIVYFRFPLRKTCFWVIFITLMLPVEVRILPTFGVVASLDMLNSYWGLSVPLIASATATFLFRQFFLTVPEELAEAARIDGAGPLKFFRDILLPLSRTNIAALFVILFIFGWNQYLCRSWSPPTRASTRLSWAFSACSRRRTPSPHGTRSWRPRCWPCCRRAGRGLHAAPVREGG